MLTYIDIINNLKEGHTLVDIHGNTAFMQNGMVVKQSKSGKTQVNARLSVDNKWEIKKDLQLSLEVNKYYKDGCGNIVHIIKQSCTSEDIVIGHIYRANIHSDDMLYEYCYQKSTGKFVGISVSFSTDVNGETTFEVMNSGYNIVEAIN